MVSRRGRCLCPVCFVQTQRSPAEDPSEYRPQGHVALTSGQLPVGAAGRPAGTPERPAWPRPTALLPHVKCQEGSPLLALLVWFLYHVDFPTREPSTLRFHLILLPRGGTERGWSPRLHQPRARGHRCIRSAQEMCFRCLLCARPWAEGGGDSVTEGVPAPRLATDVQPGIKHKCLADP